MPLDVTCRGVDEHMVGRASGQFLDVSWDCGQREPAQLHGEPSEGSTPVLRRVRVGFDTGCAAGAAWPGSTSGTWGVPLGRARVSWAGSLHWSAQALFRGVSRSGAERRRPCRSLLRRLEDWVQGLGRDPGPQEGAGGFRHGLRRWRGLARLNQRDVGRAAWARPGELGGLSPLVGPGAPPRGEPVGLSLRGVSRSGAERRRPCRSLSRTVRGLVQRVLDRGVRARGARRP